MNKELLHAVTTVEAGQHTYVDADIEEVREFISGMDHLRCAPVGHGKVKISKLKSERKSLIAMIRLELQKFDGTPIAISGVDGQQLRNAVSRYNKEHSTEFSVRTMEKDSYQVHSPHLEDRAFITQDELDKIEQEFNERYAKLSQKLRPADAVADQTAHEHQDENEDYWRETPTQGWEQAIPAQPEPMPFKGIKMVDVNADTAICSRCGDEFYKQGSSSLCGDCIEEEDLM